MPDEVHPGLVGVSTPTFVNAHYTGPISICSTGAAKTPRSFTSEFHRPPRARLIIRGLDQDQTSRWKPIFSWCPTCWAKAAMQYSCGRAQTRTGCRACRFGRLTTSCAKRMVDTLGNRMWSRYQASGPDRSPGSLMDQCGLLPHGFRRACRRPLHTRQKFNSPRSSICRLHITRGIFPTPPLATEPGRMRMYKELSTCGRR